MSIDLLFELQQEVRRLFIAGSGMAANDLRLQKLLPQLQKLGESAPVFKRMAEAVSQVLEPETGGSGSPAKLLELGVLLNSVLCTQGRTETKEELNPVEGTEVKLATALSYRKLNPLMEALTQKGQGRMEQLRQAYEDRLFQDFRVIPAAVSALGDSYAEIPDFLHEKILPEYGPDALPALQKQLRLDGGKGDARRLELIDTLFPESDSSLSILLEAAQTGSTEVRSTAIQLLGNYPGQEDFILEQADDKKKEIRKAALFALSAFATDAAIDRLYKALNSKDRDIAIEPIRQCRANRLTLSVIEHAESALERIVQRTNAGEAAEQLLADLRSLDGKRVPEVVGLLQKLLSTPGFIVQETEAAQEEAAMLLLQLDLPEADRFAVSLHERHNRKFIAYSFKAAVKLLAPEDVYERFSPELKDKKQPHARELLRALYEIAPPFEPDEPDEPDAEASPLIKKDYTREWDERWLQLFIKLDEEELVCRFTSKPDKHAIQYLIKKCEGAAGFNRGNTARMLLALFYMRSADAPRLVMHTLEKAGSRQFYYLDRVELTVLSLLPRAYAERLKQFAETVTYQSAKNLLLETAETIAAKQEQTEWTEIEEKGQGLLGWIKRKMW